MGDGDDPPRPRKSYERKSLSCTECTRRKLRCSKTVPCSACLERGRGHLCQRRDGGRRSLLQRQQHPSANGVDEALQVPVASDRQRTQATSSTPTPSSHSLSLDIADPTSHRLVDGISEDFAVTLEFLTLGRQRVLQLGGDGLNSPIANFDAVTNRPQTETVVTEAQATFIFDYHEQHLVWTHNVVHLPTFRLQTAGLFTGHPPAHPCWSALYYAMLSVSPFIQESLLSFCQAETDSVPSLALRLPHRANLTSKHWCHGLR